MRKKVIGIVGSPRRKGNTNAMVNAVLNGAKDAGADIEKIFLSDRKIELCTACDFCRKEGKCVHNDDMDEILDSMKKSDVWIFGTPVYWWGPSSLMKVFIDRWYQDQENLKKLTNKKVILAIPFESKNESTADSLVGMFQNSFLYLKKEITDIILTAGVNNINDIEHRYDIINKAYEIGKNLCSVCK